MGRLLASLSLLLCVSTLFAADDPDASADNSGGVWERTWEYTDQAWAWTQGLWQEEHINSEFARLWEGILPTLEETLALEDRHKVLPESSWLGGDQRSNQARIDDLLDEAVSILMGHGAQNDYRRRLVDLQQAMENNHRRIDQLRQRRVSAPEDSLWKKTASEVDKEIAERQAQDQRLQRELDQLKARFAQDLRGLGLAVRDDQLDALLSTVVGEDSIDMALMFENVRQLTEQLSQLMQDSQEDVVAARRYYGMYTVLLKILERMYTTMLARLNEVYLPKVYEIRERADLLMRQTKTLRVDGPDHRKILEANIEAQQLTLAATKVYERLLEAQRGKLQTSLQRLRRDLAVAMNTYETVKVTGELVALMKDSQIRLDTLLQLHVPPLRAFESQELKREFKRLTHRLQSAAQN